VLAASFSEPYGEDIILKVCNAIYDKDKHPDWRMRYDDRNQYIQEYANKIKLSLGTQNSKIGRVIIKTYRDEKDMLENLPTFLEMVINGEL